MLKRIVAVWTFLALSCLPVMAGLAAENFQKEDAAVLRAALHTQCQAKQGYVLLSSTTVAPEETYDMGEFDESGAFADLKHRNGPSVSLPEGVACNGARPHREQELQRFFDRKLVTSGKASLDEAWEKLYESFPGATGWMSVSLPGYSPKGDIAVVYTAHHCGSLCGQGFYVYLRRANGQWQVLVRFPVWVS
jgi:hypothetical protein